MPLEIGLWRVDDKPSKLATSSIHLEAQLEELIESDVTILGEPLLLLGRQVATAYGKLIDLLGSTPMGHSMSWSSSAIARLVR